MNCAAGESKEADCETVGCTGGRCEKSLIVYFW